MPNPSKISLLDNWILTVEIRLHGGEIFANEVDLGQLLETPKKHEIIYDEVDKRPCPIRTHLRNLNCNKPDLVIFEVCFQNPNPMDHPNGNWDLGADGNVLLESCDLKFTPKDKSPLSDLKLYLTDSGTSYPAQNSVAIHQASSGGEGWQSTNHIDRSGKNQLPFKGYQITADGRQISGNRTTPIISTTSKTSSLAVAVSDFWQNFPINMEATQEHVRLQLLAAGTESPTELQGGEQKTFEFAFQSSNDLGTATLESWLAKADEPTEEKRKEVGSKLPYFTGRSEKSEPRYESLTDLAIEGKDTFSPNAK